MKQSKVLIPICLIIIFAIIAIFSNNYIIDWVTLIIILIGSLFVVNETIKNRDEFINTLKDLGIIWWINTSKKSENFESQEDFKKALEESVDNKIFLNGEEYLIKNGKIINYCVKNQTQKFIKSYKKTTNYVGYIKTDNISDATELLDDEQEFVIIREIAQQVNDYFNRHGILLLKLQDDEWIFFPDENQYKKIYEEEFKIIKDVQFATAEKGAEISLTIGIAGSNTLSLKELELSAEACLRLGDSRGGGQTVVEINGVQSFYGSKLRTFEKRSKVRVRAFSKALQKEINSANNIIIMGHRNMDMDCFASCIGVYKICQSLGKDAKIVFNYDQCTYDVKRAYNYLTENKIEDKTIFVKENLGNHLKTNSLLVVVDVSSTELVEKNEIIDFFEKKIIIDHHIINDKVLQGATITYVETYASSTAEILTEIMDYIDNYDINKTIATILLAGILVDTKIFSNNTGTRTFEAAAQLRAKGATTEDAKLFFKDTAKVGKKIAKFISEFKTIDDKFAYVLTQEIVLKSDLAKVADNLIMYEGNDAAFAIGELDTGEIYISARSNNNIAIHKVMETIGGGGHSNAAAAIFTDKTLTEVEQLLITTIKEQKWK